MKSIVGGLAGAFGQGLALGLGKAIVYIVIAAIFIFIGAAVFGLIFSFLAWRAFKRKSRSWFIVWGCLASFGLSITIGAVITSILSLKGPGLLLIPILFIIGVVFVISRARRLS